MGNMNSYLKDKTEFWPYILMSLCHDGASWGVPQNLNDSVSSPGTDTPDTI